LALANAGLMQRVSVVGSSGSGKSRLGRKLAKRLDAPYIELDALHHLADWTPIEPDEFVRQVDSIAQGDAWVIDGNYHAVVSDGPVWAAADTVVWLDVPRWLAMWQVTHRSIRRATVGQELWNGNRERWSDVLSRDPDRSMIRWVWATHGSIRERYERLAADEAPGHLTFVRLHTRRDATRFLASVQPVSRRRGRRGRG